MLSRTVEAKLAFLITGGTASGKPTLALTPAHRSSGTRMRVRDAKRQQLSHRAITSARSELRGYRLQAVNRSALWALLAVTTLTGAVDPLSFLGIGLSPSAIRSTVLADCAAGMLLAGYRHRACSWGEHARSHRLAIRHQPAHRGLPRSCRSGDATRAGHRPVVRGAGRTR